MGVTGWGRGNVVINGAREARVADGQVAAETRHKGDKTMSHSRHRRFTGKRVGRGINLCPPPVSLAPLHFFFHQSLQTEPVINQLAHDKTTTCSPARFNILPTCHSLTSRRSLIVRSLFAFSPFTAAVDTTARCSRLSLHYRRHNDSLSFRFLFYFQQPLVHHVPPGDGRHSLRVHHAPPHRASLMGHEGR